MIKLILKQNKNSFILLITTLFSSISSENYSNEFIDNIDTLQNPVISNNKILGDNLMLNRENSSINEFYSINNQSKFNKNFEENNLSSFKIVFISCSFEIIIYANLVENIKFKDLIEIKHSKMERNRYYYYNPLNGKLYDKRISLGRTARIPITNNQHIQEINEKSKIKDFSDSVQTIPTKRLYHKRFNFLDNTQKYKNLRNNMILQRNNMELNNLIEREENRSNYSKQKK